MNDEHRLSNIEKALEHHGKKLDTISSTLQKIAVQGERLNTVEKDIVELRKKYDGLSDPNTGQIKKLSDFQASCPRHGELKTVQSRVNWFWVVALPMCITLIGIGVRLLMMGG